VSKSGNKCIIALPSNYENLVQTNYLFVLFNSILLKENYECVDLSVSHNCRLKQDLRTETYLKAFGTVVLDDNLPDLPKNKGLIHQGVCSALKILIQGQSGIDLNLFQFVKAKHPANEIFGDIWGKNYPVEKQILDHIINYLRNCMKNKVGDISKYRLNDQSIIDNYGLRLDMKNELISQNERMFLTELLAPCHNYDGKDPVMTGWTSLTKVKQAQDYISSIQKDLKKSKDTIKSVISYRVESCFKPYKGKAREKARKNRITILRDNIKGTPDYVAFNPTLFFAAANKLSLPNHQLNHKDDKDLQNQLNKICADIIHGTPISGLTADLMIQEWLEFLDQLRSH
jgi:hypothetical protein